ncbi:unnamed protein product, partial [Musa hybrid cultivar]
ARREKFSLRIVGLYPGLEGALPEILDGAGINPGQRGGLEIVFNQQLSRLGYNLTSCDIAPSAKMT